MSTPCSFAALWGVVAEDRLSYSSNNRFLELVAMIDRGYVKVESTQDLRLSFSVSNGEVQCRVVSTDWQGVAVQGRS